LSQATLLLGEFYRAASEPHSSAAANIDDAVDLFFSQGAGTGCDEKEEGAGRRALLHVE